MMILIPADGHGPDPATGSAPFIGGSGVAPVPQGILGVAAEVSGADWYEAAVKAKAAIATAGGEPSHIALSPAVIGDLENTRDDIGHPLFPDASTIFAARLANRGRAGGRLAGSAPENR